MKANPKTIKIKIGYEDFDEPFEVDFDEEMTLETFRHLLGEAIGGDSQYIKLHMTKKEYEEEKHKTLKEYFKDRKDSIYTLKNNDMENVINHWTGNFNNSNNSCGKDSLTKSIIHSIVPQIIEMAHYRIVKEKLPIPKKPSDILKYSNAGESFKNLFLFLDNIYKDNKSELQKNPLCKDDNFKSEEYLELMRPLIEFLAKLAKESPPTQEKGSGGSKIIFLKFSSTYVKDHQIYLFERTVISDCIGIDVRSFQNCINCKKTDILLTKIGNICIPMYDYIKTGGSKSFNELLKYYYKINNFGKENSKNGEICEKCKNSSLTYYNQISTLPEVFIIDFNYESYYNNTSIKIGKEVSFDWVLEEQIDLLKYYDGKCYESYEGYYKLSSFIGYFEWGHFINFSKIGDKWYYFNDLYKDSESFDSFTAVKNKSSDLKICLSFYKKNKCKGYEHYIPKIKEIIKHLSK